MTPLVLLLLAQQPSTMNLNVQPPTTFRCDGGIACSVSGRTLYISGSGTSGGDGYYDGGKVAEAYMADASITAQFATTANVAYSADASVFAEVSRVAYSADASFYSTEFIANPTDCGGGQYATAIAANGNLTCSTPPSGSGNGGIATVAFGSSGKANEDSDPLTVTASWVTDTSAIVFTPACSQVDGGTATADECRVVYPECAVTAITASTSFTMQCRSETGGYGQYPISYLGL